MLVNITIERLVPSTMNKPSVRIDDWSVVKDLISERYCDLQSDSHLTGYASRHRNFPSTKFIYTSRIVSVDLSKGLVETLNTTYELGEVNVEYRMWEEKQRVAAA